MVFKRNGKIESCEDGEEQGVRDEGIKGSVEWAVSSRQSAGHNLRKSNYNNICFICDPKPIMRGKLA